MRRRGIFGPARSPGRQFIDEELIIAHAHFESGRYIDAGVIFENIARMAASHNGPRAPRFYLQAGRSFLYGGNIEHGMALLENSRNLFIQYGRTEVIPLIILNLQAELQQMGLLEQSKQVAQWAVGLPIPRQSPGSAVNKHSLLPLKCPSCGGPVIPLDTIWLDDNTAECVYCGSLIRGE